MILLPILVVRMMKSLANLSGTKVNLGHENIHKYFVNSGGELAIEGIKISSCNYSLATYFSEG